MLMSTYRLIGCLILAGTSIFYMWCHLLCELYEVLHDISLHNKIGFLKVTPGSSLKTIILFTL